MWLVERAVRGFVQCRTVPVVGRRQRQTDETMGKKTGRADSPLPLNDGAKRGWVGRDAGQPSARARATGDALAPVLIHQHRSVPGWKATEGG